MGINVAFDSQVLFRALEGSFSPDSDRRKQSEDYLLWFSKQKGGVTLLLQMLSHPQCEETLRLAAAVRLKNQILSHWTLEEEGELIDSSDKNYLLENIYGTIVAVGAGGRAIRSQCFEILRHIVFNIEISSLSTLLRCTKDDLIQRENTDRLVCSLMVLRRIACRYEYHGSSMQKEVDDAINALFGPFLQIAQESSRVGLDNPDAANLIHLVLKIYFSLGLLTSPSTLLLKESLGHWIALVRFVISYFCGQEGRKQENNHFSELCNEDEDRIGDLPQFKCLKWSMRIVNRLLSRQGSRAIADDDFKKSFYMSFTMEGHATEIVKLLLLLLQSEDEGRFILTNLIHHYIWTYLRHSLQVDAIYFSAIQSNSRKIVGIYLVKTFAFSEQDEKLYRDEPEFFIQNSSDVSFQLYSSRGAASDFLREACKSRRQDFLPIISELVQYNFGTGEIKDFRGLYSCLCIIGYAGSSILRRTSDTKKSSNTAIEQGFLDGEDFLAAHISPLLMNREKWLRMRASWLSGLLARRIMAFRDPRTPKNLYIRLLELLNDSELIVGIFSAGAIVEFFKLEDADLQSAIGESLPSLLERLFRLLERIELEMIVSALDEVVECYSEQVLPFATLMIEKFCTLLSHSLGDEQKDSQSANDDQVLSRWTMLQTLNSVVRLVTTSKEVARDSVESITFRILRLFDVVFHPGQNEDQLLDYVDELGILFSNTIRIILAVDSGNSLENSARFNSLILKGLWQVYRRMIQVVGGSGGFDEVFPLIGDLSVLRSATRAILYLDPQGFTEEFAQTLLGLCGRAAASGFSEEADELLANALDVSLTSRCCDLLIPRIADRISARISSVSEELEYHPQLFRLSAMLLLYSFSGRVSDGPPHFAKISKFVVDASGIIHSKTLRRLAIITFCTLIRSGIQTVGSASLYSCVATLVIAMGTKRNSFTDDYNDSDGSNCEYSDSDYDSDSISSSDSDYDDGEDDEEEDEDDDYSPLKSVSHVDLAREILVGAPSEPHALDPQILVALQHLSQSQSPQS